MATAKKAEAAPAAREFDEIQRRAGGLKAREKELLAAQIELEQAGIRPELPAVGPSVRDWAAALLDGSAVPADRDPTPGEDLQKIVLERQAIAIALDALAEQENQARRIAAAEMLQESAAEWREIVRQRALAVLTLRRVNAAAFEFRERIRRIARTNPNLICDVTSGPLFGPPVVGDGVYTFLESAVAAGIITKKEIAQ
ncbi:MULTISPECIES: hypothetical protein [unclassified Mesorhizobium]|uniref:hypothetical protein n=1 Tax=unclassified Mesorhizobium TaxID=325217 RepID=UPI0003CE3E10|nr:hypothetical protein [Mesorhizobium sp. LNJC391B00]ESY30035.1 hypothetical protein X749_14420 [Mesorhizobium sp. LNJC391B00]